MEIQKRGSKKLWKPPSCEDFNVESQSKRIKLDNNNKKGEIIKEEVSIELVDQPKTIEELATHSKKIEEIKNWFQNTSFVKAPILLLTGPAGSAKTITMKVVASSLNYSVKEWINPVDKIDSKIEFLTMDKSDFIESRQIDKFEDFIFRASRYKSVFEDDAKNVILVEDFPNIFLWKPKLFHQFLDKYNRESKSGIVFICTDDQNLNLYNDLFPSSIKVKFGISEIKFNPINHSSMMKTLKKAMEKYQERRRLSVETLQSIAQNSNGDIRNALCNLQIFMEVSKPAKIKSTRRKENHGRQLSSDLEPISVKDSKAEFYQSLGRVLYPKVGKTEDKVQCDDRIFVHDVLELSSNFTESFFMLLHENYVDTFRSLSCVAEAAAIFSFCDAFRSEQELCEYRSLICVTGIMINNKEPKRAGFKPIKKSNAPSSCNNDNWMKRFEYSNFNTTCRILSLDIIPYLKIFSKCKNKAEIDSIQSSERSDCGEDVNIEEFDD